MINSKTVLLTSLGLFLGSGVCIANADSTRVSPSITQSQVVTSVQGKNSYRKTISVTLQNNNSLQTQTASDSETQPKTNSQKQTASDSETQPKTNSQTQTASDSETQPKTNSQTQTASDSETQPKTNSQTQTASDSETQPKNLFKIWTI